MTIATDGDPKVRLIMLYTLTCDGAAARDEIVSLVRSTAGKLEQRQQRTLRDELVDEQWDRLPYGITLGFLRMLERLACGPALTMKALSAVYSAAVALTEALDGDEPDVRELLARVGDYMALVETDLEWESRRRSVRRRVSPNRTAETTI